MKNRLFLLAGLFLLVFPSFAAAQLQGSDTAPGESCSGYAQGASRFTASPSGDGSKVVLVCDGSVWQKAGGVLPALASSKIWVGDAGGAAGAVSLSGDATLSNAGVLTIGTGAVGSTEITDGSIANADLAGSIALSKLSITGTGSASNFLRGDGSWQTAPSGADNLGNHTATQSIISDTTNTDDLGTTAIRWKDGWFAGTVTAGTFAGSGASLTSLPAANLTGTLAAISGANLTSLNATNLASGTVAAARMPALTGDVTMTAGTTATTLAANAVTSAKIADSTIVLADLAATGTKDATTFLRGDNTWAVPSGGGGGGTNCSATAKTASLLGTLKLTYCGSSPDTSPTITSESVSCGATNHGTVVLCSSGARRATFYCQNGTLIQAGLGWGGANTTDVGSDCGG